jgi:hypothetical protein
MNGGLWGSRSEVPAGIRFHFELSSFRVARPRRADDSDQDPDECRGLCPVSEVLIAMNVGRTPSSAPDPRSGLAKPVKRRPTRASTAVQGDRPTLD